jgi:hypothetical protein
MEVSWIHDVLLGPEALCAGPCDTERPNGGNVCDLGPRGQLWPAAAVSRSGN